ncbi:MAG TPA: NTP transferase domain-containing protein [Candidatus Bathyarchaeia archaeon]
MNRSAIILADSSSKGFPNDKGILELDGKPLLNHVIDAVEGLVEEVIVVTISQEQADSYSNIVSSKKVRFVVEDCKSKGPLCGAFTGFEAANGEYSALLRFDSPFISTEVLSLLFDCSIGKAAAVPRWTDQEIEPDLAVYNTKQALQATKEASEEDESDIQMIVEKLRGVRYISTMVIEQLDPDFKTFFFINTPLDLRKAAVMGKPRKTSKTKQSNIKKR